MRAPILAAALTLAAATSAFAQSDTTPGYGPDSNPVLQTPGTTAEVGTPINNLRARMMGASPSVCIEGEQTASLGNDQDGGRIASPSDNAVASASGSSDSRFCR